MAVHLSSLNATEITTLQRPENSSATYRLNADKIKENWEEIKKNSISLLSVSEEAASYENTISTEKIKNLGELNKMNSCNYSSNAFFQKDMPKITTDGQYMVNGALFSKEELEQCRIVMKSAADSIECNVDLNYEDYAQMGIAVSCVKNYADMHLNKEQAEAVNRAMSEYNEALINRQEEMLSGANYVDSEYEGLSDYYGKVRILDNGEIDALNKLKEEMSKITGHHYEPTRTGATAVVGSATNEKLINEIYDLFSNVDVTDEEMLEIAMKKYEALVKPAYLAYGINDDYGSLSRILDRDTSGFGKQISDIMIAAGYHTMNYSV